MCRIKFTTTLEQDLLKKTKEKASLEGLEGANAVIEKALRLYFANCDVTVWEKNLKRGNFQKLIVRPHQLVYEHLHRRNVRETYNPLSVSDTVLTSHGWHKVWQMKK